MASSEGSQQRITPATDLATLVAELGTGNSVTLCFLFDEPRGGAKSNWVGLNSPVQILHQMPVGELVVIAGVRKSESTDTYVTLTISTLTGEGYATFGADLSGEDLSVLEVSFAAVNETSASKLTA